MNQSATQNPLFSVLIANYNNGCYLQDAINSVLLQSYPNWEIVIVDDCSTDNSPEIYKELVSDPRIHIYYNDVNSGAGYTKRRCAELAHGDICGFVDPDDALAGDDVLESMVREHQSNPDASFVYSGMYITDDRLNIIDTRPGRSLEKGQTAIETKSWPYNHFVTFKRSFYLKTAGINPIMKRAVDQDLYYRLEEVGESVYLDKIQYYYRKNSNSISLNNNEYKAYAWHCYACIEAMKRRGWDNESYMLFPINKALLIEFNKGVAHTKNTRTYKIGDFVLTPFRWLFRLLNH